MLCAPNCKEADQAGAIAVAMIQCSPQDIPCGDNGRTAVDCSGAGVNLLAGATLFTWKCTHAGTGIPTCQYVAPAGASESCTPFEDAIQCTSMNGQSSIELHCSGRAREVCTLTVAEGNSISDPRKQDSRFQIGLLPECADLGAAGDAAAD